MPLSSDGRLTECLIDTNCALVEWDFEDANSSYNRLIDIASSLPRTIVMEQNDIYWHGICRSLVFRFPDDLEILKIPNKKIQVRSASRYGIGDLGVNRNRIAFLYRELQG